MNYHKITIQPGLKKKDSKNTTLHKLKSKKNLKIIKKWTKRPNLDKSWQKH